MKNKLTKLQNEIEKLKFHNSCLLYLIGELTHAVKVTRGGFGGSTKGGGS